MVTRRSAHAHAEELYTIEELPAALGMSLAAVRFHLYKSRQLRASLRFGRTPVFTCEDIEVFRRSRRPAHRPRAGAGGEHNGED